jgi:hypothetical protein
VSVSVTVKLSRVKYKSHEVTSHAELMTLKVRYTVEIKQHVLAGTYCHVYTVKKVLCMRDMIVLIVTSTAWDHAIRKDRW